MNERADTDLVAAWLRGRSLARGLPEPVAHSNGWRVETGSEAEIRRYVFAASSPAIVELARSVDHPRIFVKACIDETSLRSLIGPGWQLSGSTWMMTGPADLSGRCLPKGYTATTEQHGGAIMVRVVAADGTLAASGHAAETDGAFVYDRIVTAPDHQRRGLGGVVMARLMAERQSGSSRCVLVATDQGRALYRALGWQVHAPFTTAVIPDPVV